MAIKKTNEKCYICDFHRPVEGNGFTYHVENNQVNSMYFEGLTEDYQVFEGRYVFISDLDGKPVCNQCSNEADELFTYEEEFNAPVVESRLLQDWDDHEKIDWSKTQRNDNGTIKFPLPLKDQPRAVGWKFMSRSQRWPLTDDLKAQAKALLSTPKRIP